MKTIGRTITQHQLTVQSLVTINSLQRVTLRLMGDAGTKMPTKRVDAYHCSTIWSGWLDGTHPTMEDGEVYRKICFSDSPTIHRYN